MIYILSIPALIVLGIMFILYGQSRRRFYFGQRRVLVRPSGWMMAEPGAHERIERDKESIDFSLGLHTFELGLWFLCVLAAIILGTVYAFG